MSAAMRRTANPGISGAKMDGAAMRVMLHGRVGGESIILLSPSCSAPGSARSADLAPRAGAGRASRIVNAATGFPAHLARQFPESSDAVFRRGMGREQIVHPLPGERIDDEKM